MRKLNREQMKALATVSMFADHICKIFFPGNSTANIVRCTFGRFAFVIFLLLFVEGFFHIRKENYGKHIRDLGLCALASFPGYSYMHTGTWTSAIGFGNVMTEFLLTFLLLAGLQRCGRTPSGIVSATAIFLLATELVLVSDIGYAFAGPLAAFAIWCIGDRCSYVSECIITVLAIIMATQSLWEIFGVIPLFFYDVEKKPKRKRKKAEKYFYYVFYPLHIAVLGLIKCAL